MIKSKLFLFLTFAMFTLCGWAYDFQKDGIYYNILSEDDKTVEVTSGDVAYTGDIIIPSEVNGYSVTQIGKQAFRESTISSVSIPTTVKRISPSAFYQCNGLTSVVIPSKEIIDIGDYAFFGCENLTTLTIYGEVGLIGYHAFFGCTSLKDIYLYARTINEKLNIAVKAFDNVSNEIKTHVYYGMEETYQLSPYSSKHFPNIVGDLIFTVHDGEVYTDTHEQKFEGIEYVRDFENTNWQPLYVPFDIYPLDVKDEFEIAMIKDVYIDITDYKTMDVGAEHEKKSTLCVSWQVLLTNLKYCSYHCYPYLIKPLKTGTIQAWLNGKYLQKVKYPNEDECREEIRYLGETIYPAKENTFLHKFREGCYLAFKGTYSGVSAADMTANNYLTVKDSKICVPNDNMEALSPMRWYMYFEHFEGELPNIGAIKFLFYDIDGNLVDSFENNLSADTNTTGISDTEAIITSTSDIFTIDGRKVDGKNLKPGIYIKNGKKYIVK